jgi:hypothetical protein
MLKRILGDFKQGVERVQWFSRLFSERMKIEIAIFKLLHETDKKAKTRDDLLRKIGERVVELKDMHEKNILRDSVVAEAVSEIATIEKNIDDLRHRASEMGRATE